MRLIKRIWQALFQRPITIVVNTPFTSDADTGRALINAIRAYEQQTGRRSPDPDRS